MVLIKTQIFDMIEKDDEIKRLLDKKFREIIQNISAKANKVVERVDEVIIEVTDADFKEKVVRKSFEKPVIVDFWAEWCAPCLMLSPILERVVREFSGSVLLAKVNVDRSPVLANRFGIMSIPTVAMFKNGKIVDYFVGALPAEDVRRWIRKHIT